LTGPIILYQLYVEVATVCIPMQSRPAAIALANSSGVVSPKPCEPDSRCTPCAKSPPSAGSPSTTWPHGHRGIRPESFPRTIPRTHCRSASPAAKMQCALRFGMATDCPCWKLDSDRVLVICLLSLSHTQNYPHESSKAAYPARCKRSYVLRHLISNQAVGLFAVSCLCADDHRRSFVCVSVVTAGSL